MSAVLSLDFLFYRRRNDIKLLPPFFHLNRKSPGACWEIKNYLLFFDMIVNEDTFPGQE